MQRRVKKIAETSNLNQALLSAIERDCQVKFALLFVSKIALITKQIECGCRHY